MTWTSQKLSNQKSLVQMLTKSKVSLSELCLYEKGQCVICTLSLTYWMSYFPSSKPFISSFSFLSIDSVSISLLTDINLFLFPLPVSCSSASCGKVEKGLCRRWSHCWSHGFCFNAWVVCKGSALGVINLRNLLN